MSEAFEPEESNLVKHARSELERLGNGPEIDDHVLDMIRIFAQAGHSGYSGFYTIALLERLLKFQNLTPLTNNPDEWDEVGDGMWQNKRNSGAFSKDGGKTFYFVEDTPDPDRPYDKIYVAQNYQEVTS